jgi:uncharacterized protein (TIGR00255 family)
MSMTGYGRGESHGDEVSITVDVKSVNHRFLDVHVRCPGKFVAWEPRIRSIVREHLSRGKVDLFLNVKEWGRGGGTLRVNRVLLSSYVEEAGRIQEDFGIRSDLSFSDLLRVPDLFVLDGEGGDDPIEALWPHTEKALRGAIAMLQSSRRTEGENLRAVIRDALALLSRYTADISALTQENKGLAAARYKERIATMAGETGIDPVRLHQEAAYLLDRLDITEECDRLRSHLGGLQKLVDDGGEALGKRFDFLLQEVFRELNTASNKSAHPVISEKAVTAKTELEKIREQIQNVE